MKLDENLDEAEKCYNCEEAISDDLAVKHNAI